MRALNKSEQEFISKLHEEMYDFLFRFACFRLSDTYDAQDAVQNTFLAAQNNIVKIMDCENPQGWLKKALEYMILREFSYRDKVIKRFHELDVYDFADTAPYAHDYSPNLLKILKKKKYDILYRKYVEGYTVQELADTLGIKFETCKKRIQTARRKLKQEWE